MGDIRKAITILSVNPKGRDHLEELGVDGSIILICNLNRMRLCGLESSGYGQRSVTGSCEYGNECFDFVT
jgi:hypothetical protein